MSPLVRSVTQTVGLLLTLFYLATWISTLVVLWRVRDDAVTQERAGEELLEFVFVGQWVWVGLVLLGATGALLSRVAWRYFRIPETELDLRPATEPTAAASIAETWMPSDKPRTPASKKARSSR